MGEGREGVADVKRSALASDPFLRARIRDTRTHTQERARVEQQVQSWGCQGQLGVQPNSSRLQSISHFRLWPAQQDFILIRARVPMSGSFYPKPELDFSGCK